MSVTIQPLPPTSAAVVEFFESESNTAHGISSNEADIWRECSKLYGKRLWHQLSSKLQELIAVVSTRQNKKQGDLIQIYEKGIQEFEAK